MHLSPSKPAWLLSMVVLLVGLPACRSGENAAGSTPTPALALAAAPESRVTIVFFGMASADGTGVSEQQWLAFVTEAVTPRFPDGLTVLEGAGQYLSPSDHKFVTEHSKLVLLVHDGSAASMAKIDAIAAEYQRRFKQEAVLRATMGAKVAM
ncbi:MAG: DUF3574 domain-containing protein [Phycisphaerales bacterium]